MKKRLTALFTAAVMSLSLLGASVFADAADYVYDFEGEDIVTGNYQSHGFNRNCVSGAVTFTVKDGVMKYQANQNGNSMEKTFKKDIDGVDSIDGAQYRAIEIRAKITDAIKPSGLDKPSIAILYKGVYKESGSSCSVSEARKALVEYETVYNEETGLFSSSDYVVYTINMADVTDWTNCNINNTVFQVFKNGTGTAEIDYIKYLKTEKNEITVGECENGTIVTDVQSAYVGTTVNVTAAPEPGFELSELYVNGVKTDESSFVMPNEAVTLTAKFVPEAQYQINLDDSVQNGTLSVDYTEATKGTTVTVTTTPDVGYELKNIIVDGEPIEGNTFKMPKADVYVSAEFALRLMEGDKEYDDPENVNFGFESGSEGFTLSYTKDNAMSVSDSCLVLEAGATSNSISKTFTTPLDGSKYYGMEVKIKYENATVPTAGYDKPTFVMLYNGKVKSDGSSLGLSEARKSESTIALNYDETTKTYNSGDDFEIIYVNLSDISRWKDCDITSVRIDTFKNGTGKAKIDYIKFVCVPSVGKVGGELNASSVECETDTVNFALTAPVNAESINSNTVKIINELGDDVEILDVAYDSAKKVISAKVGESIKSDTIYRFSLSGLYMNEENPFKAIGAAFKTAARDVAVKNIAKNDDDLTITLKNNTSNEKSVLVIAAEYVSGVFRGYKAKNITISGGQEKPETISGISSGEVYIWDNSGNVPKLITNEIIKY